MTEKNRERLFEYSVSATLAALTAVLIVSSKSALVRSVAEFSVHIMLGFLLLSIVAMLLDKRKVMFTSLACAALLALWLKNASNDQLKLPIINEEVKLSLAHVNLGNIDDRLSEVLDILEREMVDLISFQELTPDWTYTLDDELQERYPHRFVNTRIDPYGMAIYSRYPYVKRDTILADGIPSFAVDVSVAGEVFHVISSYLTPALDNKSLEKAAGQLEAISANANGAGGHVIALGEYNMVYWTQEIRDFRSSSKLKNSRRDIAQGNLRVPYDHIFFSPGLECTSFKELIGAGQNYLGIMGTYQVKSPLPVDGELSLRY